ncbi:hypothetical protein [Planotetraspora sp. GP83]|uniref:hypothetical protein n=1 Tax=Planotetraspora sp. GP83 TaxID=3156264 RepID=UPI003517E858
MLDTYLLLGDTEIANHARLDAYLQSVGSPLTTREACGCPTFTAQLVGDQPYTTPQADAAPWWDPNVPASAEFAGLMVLEVAGLGDHPVKRTVTTAVAGGAALGPPRVQPRTIVVTALVLGSTCCGVDYGLNWLARALEGCGTPKCGDCPSAACGGTDLTVYNCCPSESLDVEEFTARHRRTLRRVALVDGPTVVARAGDGCTTGDGCSTGADILTVEFTLTAATPWLWADPVPILDAAIPRDSSNNCIQWCVHPSANCPGPCALAACPEPPVLCSDPTCRTPTPPSPPPPDTCFCQALAPDVQCFDLDRSSRARWFPDAPVIVIDAGAAALRRLTVTFYERTAAQAGMTCAQIADAGRCAPHSVYHAAYVPGGGTLTLDGQVGRATVTCQGVTETSPDVFGRDGAPPSWRLLECNAFCVCISSDPLFTPAADATVSISLSARGS